MTRGPQHVTTEPRDERLQRIRHVIDECLVQRASGQLITDAALVARHPELMPELDEELKRVRLIAGARQRLDGVDVATAARISTSRNASASSIRLQCPDCEARVFLAADASWSNVNCSACGRDLELVGDDGVVSGLQPGSIVGRFELLNCIGSGGFGVVWKARDPQLDRVVAVKVPRRGELTNGEAELFFREARAAAQVRHPNIVSIHEVGRDGDVVYLVSDFVDGLPLSECLKRKRFTSREVAMLCRQIAQALAHIHGRGIVHRDLKPANVIVTTDDAYGLQSHVTDFGLARRSASEVTVTVHGQLMGTPAYMSPEQAVGGGHAAGPATDIYSLGVILFELLTGEQPFRGAPATVIDQVLHVPPVSPRRLNRSLPCDLETITLKCLEKSPAGRYITARALADDLDLWLRGEPIVARPLGRVARADRWRRRHPVATIVAIVLLLGGPAVGLAMGTLAWRASVAQQMAESAEQRTGQLLYASTLRNVQIAVERHDFVRAEELLLGLCSVAGQTDLRSFPWYYWWRRSHPGLIATIPLPANHDVDAKAMEDLRRIVTTMVPQFEYPDDSLLKRVTVPLNRPYARPWSISLHAPAADSTHAGKMCDAAQSADERMSATCGRDGTVQVWDHLGEKRATLRANPQAQFEQVAISPKCTFVAAATIKLNADRETSNSEIYVWNVESGQIHRRWELPNVRCFDLAFSPDETQLAVAGGAAPLLIDLESGEQRTLTAPGPNVIDCVYSPDGRLMVGLSKDANDLWLWDLASGKIQRTLSPTSHPYAVTFFPTAQHLVFVTENTLQLWSIDDEDDSPLLEPQALRRLAFTDDGRLLSETSSRWISLWSLSDCQRIRVLGLGLRNMSFSSQANVVAAGYGSDVLVYSAITGHQLHTLSGHTRPVGSCYMGESGRIVVSGDADSPDPAVAIIWDARSGKSTHHLPGHYREVKAIATAPDERTLVTVDGDRVLRTWDVTNGKLIHATDAFREIWGGRGVQQLEFNRDGTSLYACSADGVQEIDPTTGALRRKLADGVTSIGYFCLSPDGKTLAVARGKWAEHERDEGVVELWDLASGERETSFGREYGSAICVAFSPDGRTLASGHRNGKIVRWQADTDDDMRRQALH